MDASTHTELGDFIDIYKVENKCKEDRTITNRDEKEKSFIDTEMKRKNDDIWQAIAEAANSWSQQIIDAECFYAKSTDFRSNVENSLYRLQLEGFLSIHDAEELQYTTNLWVELLNSLSSFLVGCTFLKRKVLSLLLKLYDGKQISEELFLETCVRLTD